LPNTCLFRAWQIAALEACMLGVYLGFGLSWLVFVFLTLSYLQG